MVYSEDDSEFNLYKGNKRSKKEKKKRVRKPKKIWT